MVLFLSVLLMTEAIKRVIGKIYISGSHLHHPTHMQRACCSEGALARTHRTCQAGHCLYVYHLLVFAATLK